MSDKPNSLSSLATYAMSDSDGEEEEFHKLSGNISGSDDESSKHSQAPSRTYSPVILSDTEPPTKKKTAGISGLVSYGGGQDDEDSDQEGKPKENQNEEESPSDRSVHSQNGTIESETSHPINSESVEEVARSPFIIRSGDNSVQMPPSPPGRCSRALEEKIAKMHDRMRFSNFNLDATLQQDKTFRNPSIYEKLISHVGLNEKGTNYPPELYDPSIWDKSSYYDELSKQQVIEMEKKNKEKKERAKVEFVTATKPDVEISGSRKSKWDSAGGAVQSQSGAPPVGSLIKKK